jgi:Protein of unknown function (DUF2934)
MNDVIGLAREQRIRERAYQLWEEAGKPEGEGLDHWSRATEAIAVEDARYELAAGGSTEPVQRIDRLAS